MKKWSEEKYNDFLKKMSREAEQEIKEVKIWMK